MPLRYIGDKRILHKDFRYISCVAKAITRTRSTRKSSQATKINTAFRAQAGISAISNLLAEYVLSKDAYFEQQVDALQLMRLSSLIENSIQTVGYSEDDAALISGRERQLNSVVLRRECDSHFWLATAIKFLMRLKLVERSLENVRYPNGKVSNDHSL